MKIAHFVQRYPPALGGSEAYFARLSRTCAERGSTVSVFTTTALDLEAFWSHTGQTLPAGISTADGAEVRRYGVQHWPGRRYLLRLLSLVPQAQWRCLTMPCNPIALGMLADARKTSVPFDVVHATAFPYAWPIVCARILAHRVNASFFITPFLHLGDARNPADKTRQAYLAPHLRWLLSTADRIFVQTEIERLALLERRFPIDKIRLIGLGVDPAECTGGNRQTARQAWNVHKDAVVVGHLANNSEEKGSADLLRAAQNLWDAGVVFKVVLAGPEMPNFRNFWKSYQHKDRVQRLGVLSESQKRDFYAGLDLFALPSRSDSFGLVLLEAWANGLPNLAYRAGGVAEIIHHEDDGLLADCGDVPALTRELGRLIRREDLRRSLGAVGLVRTTTEFRWEDKLARVLEEYERR